MAVAACRSRRPVQYGVRFVASKRARREGRERDYFMSMRTHPQLAYTSTPIFGPRSTSTTPFSFLNLTQPAPAPRAAPTPNPVYLPARSLGVRRLKARPPNSLAETPSVVPTVAPDASKGYCLP